MKYIPFILLTVTTNAVAQLMLKHGMSVIGPSGPVGGSLISKGLYIVFSPWVFLGLCMFVLSTASHLFVLSKVELSYAYPFLSLAYVVVAIAAYLLFGEQVNAMRIAGIGLICIGTVFVAQSGRERSGPKDDIAVLGPASAQEMTR